MQPARGQLVTMAAGAGGRAGAGAGAGAGGGAGAWAGAGAGAGGGGGAEGGGAGEACFEAALRGGRGTRDASRLRAGGRVPGVLLAASGSGDARRDNLNIEVDSTELIRVLNSVDNPALLGARPMRLRVAGHGEGGGARPVLLRQAQLHSVDDGLLNVVFQEIDPSARGVKVKVPVKLVGGETCPGVRRGGYLNVLRPVVECICRPDAIPSQVVVDVAHLDKGGKVLLDELAMPEGVLRVVAKHRQAPVVKVSGKIRD